MITYIILLYSQNFVKGKRKSAPSHGNTCNGKNLSKVLDVALVKISSQRIKHYRPVNLYISIPYWDSKTISLVTILPFSLSFIKKIVFTKQKDAVICSS